MYYVFSTAQRFDTAKTQTCHRRGPAFTFSQAAAMCTRSLDQVGQGAQHVPHSNRALRSARVDNSALGLPNKNCRRRPTREWVGR
jgi:hypothetical protein